MKPRTRKHTKVTLICCRCGEQLHTPWLPKTRRKAIYCALCLITDHEQVELVEYDARRHFPPWQDR